MVDHTLSVEYGSTRGRYVPLFGRSVCPAERLVQAPCAILTIFTIKKVAATGLEDYRVDEWPMPDGGE